MNWTGDSTPSRNVARNFETSSRNQTKLPRAEIGAGTCCSDSTGSALHGKGFRNSAIGTRHRQITESSSSWRCTRNRCAYLGRCMLNRTNGCTIIASHRQYLTPDTAVVFLVPVDFLSTKTITGSAFTKGKKSTLDDAHPIISGFQQPPKSKSKPLSKKRKWVKILSILQPSTR